MNKHILLLFPCIIISNYLIAQKWTYSSGVDPFDGKYKTSSIIGTGGEFPYTNPQFVINLFNDDQLNVYIANAGYAGCSGNLALHKI